MIIEEEIIKSENFNNNIPKSESNVTESNNINITSQISLPKDDVWETDEGSDNCNYYRLKMENVKKIKNELGKSLRNKTFKYKKIDEELYEKLKIRETYFKNKVYPFIQFKDKIYSEDESLNKIILDHDRYNVEKKPEIGSCLIFEINRDNEINLLDVSKEYFDVSTKIHYLPAGTLNIKTNTIVRRKRKKKANVINVVKEQAMKNLAVQGVSKNKKKKKKKRLVKHKKNSTIIQIKKIK